MKNLIEINNLYVKTQDKSILKGINLAIKPGEIHVVMGPNGAGKSTLANAILSNPSYKKTRGNILFDGEDITKFSTSDVAKKGIFLSFQSPEEIEGISLFNFIKTAKTNITGKQIDYFYLRDDIIEDMEKLNISQGMENRDLNVGFSGGEKKKSEILQMLQLEPKFVILDEIDSGLDVDAIRTVSKGIDMYINKNRSVLIITHSTKLLEYINVDYVHVLIDGKIVKTGTSKLAKEIDKNGYTKFKEIK